MKTNRRASKPRQTLEIGGYKVAARLDGPILRVEVFDASGEKAERLCLEDNEGRGLAFTADEDLLALDGAYGIASPKRWSCYERAERDPKFRRIARLSEHDLKNWRKWKAEEEAEVAKRQSNAVVSNPK